MEGWDTAQASHSICLNLCILLMSQKVPSVCGPPHMKKQHVQPRDEVKRLLAWDLLMEVYRVLIPIILENQFMHNSRNGKCTLSISTIPSLRRINILRATES